MTVAVKVKAPPSFVISYSGGHPLFPRPCKLLVWGNASGVHLRFGKNIAVISWDKIKSLTKVTWTELRVDSNGVEVSLLFGDGANGYALLSRLIAGDARLAPDVGIPIPKTPWTQFAVAFGIALAIIVAVVIAAVKSE